MLSKHNGVKLEINNKKIIEKSPKIWKLGSTLLYNPWVKEVVSRNIQKDISQVKMEIEYIKMGAQLKQC